MWSCHEQLPFEATVQGIEWSLLRDGWERKMVGRQKTAKRKRCQTGVRRRTCILTSMVLAALLASSDRKALADESAGSGQHLEEALKVGGSKSVRLILLDGRTVIGRIVKIGSETLTIRRPSGGLRALAFSDIVELNIKMDDGAVKRGRIMRMADGNIGWTADDDANPDLQTAGVETDVKADTGGPLIRLDKDILDQAVAPIDDTTDENAEVEAIAVKPADVDEPAAVTPQAVNPPGSGTISLSVTADETSEDDKLIYFRLTLSEPAEQSILVIYTMINDTAVAPGDYTHRQGVVVFEPGEIQTIVATSIVNDEAVEGAESFVFFVTADPSAVSIDQRKVVATIEDDDG